DPGVRQLVAKRWIPVRVDRDDRPDIDSRYQLVASAFTKGKTGLPITAFLFATGEAMWADTFIPLEDREGKPGLRTLLFPEDQMWRTRFPDAQKNAQFVQLTFDYESKQTRQVSIAPEVLSAVLRGPVERAHDAYG